MINSITGQLLTTFIVSIFAYLFWYLIYNIYFHPLRRFPGPKSWAASRLVFIRSLWAGNLVNDVEKIHKQYGPVVRIAPNEISFAKSGAWQDIYATRVAGQAPFPKNPVWWSAQPGQPDSLITIQSHKEHARMRRLLANGFTEAAVREQESIVQSYVYKLIERLSDIVEADPESEIDIVPWFNFTTFDIVGDLGFGEAFDCLEKSKYHPWVALIFNHFKASAYVASVRFYPLADKLLMSMLPKSVMKLQQEHFQQVVDKVNRRMNFEVDRPDFMSHVIKHNENKKDLQAQTREEDGMSRAEIDATFNIITVAGSETTATVLSGTLNYLTRNTAKLDKLIKEIRSRFIEGEKELSFEALRKCEYLNAVLKEGMRLCPPIPAGLPRCVPPEGGSVCGISLPGGTDVSVHAWTLSRDPSAFHDPLSFIPERWLDASRAMSSPFAKDVLAAVQPFSVGPRHCIGKNLAWAELRLILARLVWSFDIESVKKGGQSNPIWEKQKTYMLVEKEPLCLKLRPVRRYS